MNIELQVKMLYKNASQLDEAGFVADFYYIAKEYARQQNGTKPNVMRIQQCSEHKPSDLPYLEWFDDAYKRAKAGQKQKQCPKCSRWFWEDQY